MEAVLSAVDNEEWEDKFAVIAHQASQLGPSHRAHLAALKQLPAQCNRGYALQQAGVGYLLRSLCLTPKKVHLNELLSQCELAMSPHAVFAVSCASCSMLCWWKTVLMPALAFLDNYITLLYCLSDPAGGHTDNVKNKHS